MRTIRVSDKATKIIIRIAAIAGSLLLSLIAFLFAFSAYLHWEWSLVLFLSTSISFLIINTILSLFVRDYYAGLLIHLIDIITNNEVMSTDYDYRMRAVRGLSVFGLNFGMIFLLASFFSPNAWILAAAGFFTLQYIMVTVISVSIASRNHRNSSAESAPRE